METINLGAADGLENVDWPPIVEQLEVPDREGAPRHTTWLATLNEDGSPHVTSVGAMWVDGSFWFQTGRATRKARNVARDARCSIATSLRDADVVVEGAAELVTDRESLTKLAAAWAGQGWPAEVDESGTGITAPFNAPSQGPPPWNVYRLVAHSATVVSNIEPGGSSRFRF